MHPFKKTTNKSKNSVYYLDTSEQPVGKLHYLRVTYTDQKLSKKLQIKVENQHKHDLVYDSKCPEPTCNEDYLGETGSRILESSADNWGKYKQSHLLRHALNSNHKTADMRDFKIIDFSYHNNRLKGKI